VSRTLRPGGGIERFLRGLRPTSLMDRLLRLRDRLLASPRFQRWAAAFPLTRPFAQRRARALFDLCAGFVYTQILTAAVRLGVFERLADGARTAPEVGRAIGLEADGTRRLLDACVALRLLERRGGGRYGLAVLGAALLGNPAIARMVDHHALLYADLEDPVALLRAHPPDTRLRRFWAYADSGARDLNALRGDQIAEYSALMASSQNLIAEDIAEAYPLRRHRRLLDVAGGEGAFLETIGRRVPGLGLSLFDLPPVAERARTRLGGSDLAERVEITGGDVFRDPLPTGADIATLVRVLHDHHDDEARQILGAVRRALPAGGTLLVAEPMARTKGAEAIGDAYFGFYLLAMGTGRPRTVQELRDLLRSSGFEEVQKVSTRRPLFTAALTARVSKKPDAATVYSS